MVDLHGGSMNGSTFIEFSMAPQKLILIRFKIILDLTQPFKCLEVLCAAKTHLLTCAIDKAEYSAFQSTLNSAIVSYRIVSYDDVDVCHVL